MPSKRNLNVRTSRHEKSDQKSSRGGKRSQSKVDRTSKSARKHPGKRAKMENNSSTATEVKETAATAISTMREKLAPKSKDEKRCLPITLLSGFLGSGKTTLLQYILKSPDHGLRIAVVVNDMAAINIDAHLIRSTVTSSSTHPGSSSTSSANNKLVALQNGCICCTLRGDFVLELARLAKSGMYDYVLIESTGISEPQQVAEGFTKEFSMALVEAGVAVDVNDVVGGEAEEKKDGKEAVAEDGFTPEEKWALKKLADEGGLNSIAKLDTTVTVVDAFRFFSEFETIELLHERFASEIETPEDERTVSDLMVDQIEFADVVLVNKIDMVDALTLVRIRGLIKTLNPGCRLIETSLKPYKKDSGLPPLDITAIISTGLYSEVTSITSSGWLKSVHEMTVIDNHGKKVLAPKPETEEYGINSFVYTARRPFHPGRLFALVYDKFVILEPQDQEEEDRESDEEEEDEAKEGDEKGDEAPAALTSKQRRSSNASATSCSFSSSSSSARDHSASDSDKHASSATTTSASNAASPSPSSETKEPFLSFPDIPLTTRLANKKAHSTLSPLLRSKGFIWLATRPHISGDWSSAGMMLTVSGGMPWFCCVPEEEWGVDAVGDALEANEVEEDVEMKGKTRKEMDGVRELIKKDFVGEWGDRRQEIVMIGTGLDVPGLTALMNSCLLDDEEMERWEVIMRDEKSEWEEKEDKLAEVWDDGWEAWKGADEEGDDGHVHGAACAL